MFTPARERNRSRRSINGGFWWCAAFFRLCRRGAETTEDEDGDDDDEGFFGIDVCKKSNKTRGKL